MARASSIPFVAVGVIALGVALSEPGRAQLPNRAASPAPSASPIPMCGAGVVLPDAQPSEKPSDVVLAWTFGSAASPCVVGSSDRFPKTIDVPLPGGATTPVRLSASSGGLVVMYDAPLAWTAKREIDGVRFASDETRVKLELAVPQTPALVVEANGYRHCVVSGLPHLRDDQVSACSVSTDAPIPGVATCPPDPKVTKPPSKAATPQVAASADPRPLCGTLTVQYRVLREWLNLTAVRDHRTIAATVSIVAPSATTPASAGTVTFTVANADGTRPARRVDGEPEISGASGASPTPAATGKSQGAANSVQQRNDPTHPRFSGGASIPLMQVGKVTAELHGIDVQQVVTKQTTDFLKQYGSSFRGASYRNGIFSTPEPGASPPSSNDAVSAGNDLFESVVPYPYRGGYTTVFGLEALDPKSIDLKSVKTVTDGARFEWRPGVENAGLEYLRDATADKSILGLHLDRFVGPLSVGFTHVYGRQNLEHESNTYVTHDVSTNEIAEIVGRLGNFKATARYGTVGTGRDRYAALSYADPLGSRIDDTNGTYSTYGGIIGYRALDAGYDPVGTKFDPFVGTQSLFGVFGYTQRRPDGAKYFEVSVHDAVARDPGLRFDAFSVEASHQVLKKTTLSFKHLTSYIAASIQAKTDGAVKVTDATNGREMLDNHSTEVNLAYSPTSTLEASAGLSWSATPKCSKDAQTPQRPCSWEPSKKITASLDGSFFDRLLVHFDTQPQSLKSSTTDANTVPISRTITTGLVVLHTLCTARWDGIGPYLTYTNNISEDSAVFTPGSLIEYGLDIAIGNGNVGPLRLSSKRAYDKGFSAVPLSGSAHYIGLLGSFPIASGGGKSSNARAIWNGLKRDVCAKKAGTSTGS